MGSVWVFVFLVFFLFHFFFFFFFFFCTYAAYLPPTSLVAWLGLALAPCQMDHQPVSIGPERVTPVEDYFSSTTAKPVHAESTTPAGKDWLHIDLKSIRICPIELQKVITAMLTGYDNYPGIRLKDRMYRLRVYKDCFVGSELVTWFVDYCERKHIGIRNQRNRSLKDANGKRIYQLRAIERKDATIFLQHLLRDGVFEHVLGKHTMQDAYLFYRIVSHDDSFVLNKAPLTLEDEARWREHASNPLTLSADLLTVMLGILRHLVGDVHPHICDANLEAIRKSKEFEMCVLGTRKLRFVDLMLLDPMERMCFFINTYNLLSIHALLTHVDAGHGFYFKEDHEKEEAQEEPGRCEMTKTDVETPEQTEVSTESPTLDGKTDHMHLGNGNLLPSVGASSTHGSAEGAEFPENDTSFTAEPVLLNLTFFQRASYQIGDSVFSLYDIEHRILRSTQSVPVTKEGRPKIANNRLTFARTDPRRAWVCEFWDERINFALCTGVLSSPRPRVFVSADKFEETLAECVQNYLDRTVSVEIIVHKERAEEELALLEHEDDDMPLPPSIMLLDEHTKSTGSPRDRRSRNNSVNDGSNVHFSVPDIPASSTTSPSQYVSRVVHHTSPLIRRTIDSPLWRRLSADGGYPPIRLSRTPISPLKLNNQNDSKSSFGTSEIATRILKPSEERQVSFGPIVVRLPKIFEWYVNDFGGSKWSCLEWCLPFFPVSLQLYLLRHNYLSSIVRGDRSVVHVMFQSYCLNFFCDLSWTRSGRVSSNGERSSSVPWVCKGAHSHTFGFNLSQVESSTGSSAHDSVSLAANHYPSPFTTTPSCIRTPGTILGDEHLHQSMHDGETLLFVFVDEVAMERLWFADITSISKLRLKLHSSLDCSARGSNGVGETPPSLLAYLIREYAVFFQELFNPSTLSDSAYMVHPGLESVIDTLTALHQMVCSCLAFHGRLISTDTQPRSSRGSFDAGKLDNTECVVVPVEELLTCTNILRELEDFLFPLLFGSLYGWYKAKLAAEDVALVCKRESARETVTLGSLDVPEFCRIEGSEGKVPYAESVEALNGLISVGREPKLCVPTRLLVLLSDMIDNVQKSIHRYWESVAQSDNNASVPENQSLCSDDLILISCFVVSQSDSHLQGLKAFCNFMNDYLTKASQRAPSWYKRRAVPEFVGTSVRAAGTNRAPGHAITPLIKLQDTKLYLLADAFLCLC